MSAYINWEEEVYDFWFENNNEIPNGKDNKRWFMGGVDMDNLIKKRFYSLVGFYEPDYVNTMDLYNIINEPIDVLLKNLDKWKKKLIGRIILGDQIFRHFYRGELYSFAWEKYNRNVIMNLFGKLSWNVKKIWDLFTVGELLFLLLPLVHYEPGRGNKYKSGLTIYTFFEIEKTLNFWKECLDKLPTLVKSEDKLPLFKKFVEKAIHNVRRHYEELKMNNGCYVKRNELYLTNIENRSNQNFDHLE